MRNNVRGIALAAALCTAAISEAQVKVTLDEVVDNRVSAGEWQGTLELRTRLEGGSALDKAQAARLIVKDARDDRGNSLSEGRSTPDFMDRNVNGGLLGISLTSPPRDASTVKVKGSVELFAPSRDPNAIVTIAKALAKLDAPFTAKGLKNAKVVITPLSRAAYAELQKTRKLDERAIAEIRAEGKRRGATEEQIEKGIEMAKAFEGMDGDVPEHAVILSGTKADFDRIHSVEILGADGKPMSLPSRTVSTRGQSTVMMLIPSEAPPSDAALQISLLTDKSRVATPFELTVKLP